MTAGIRNLQTSYTRPRKDVIGSKAVQELHHKNTKNDQKDEINNTVRYTAMMLYAMANAEEIPAKKMDYYSTRDFFIKQNLRKELELGREWKWGASE